MLRPVYGALAMIMASLPAAAGAQGLVAQPERGQSQATQDQDRYACHEQAVNQTGFDPAATTAPQDRSGGALRGALVGGAIGGIGGSLGGEFGEGAAIGAATGGLLGGVRQSRRNNKDEDRYEAQVSNYNNALAACMRSRGYAVN